MFAAAGWVLIGGFLSVLAPGLIVSLSLWSLSGKGSEEPESRRGVKSAGCCKPLRAAVATQNETAAKLKEKDQVSQIDDEEGCGIPAFLGTQDTTSRRLHRTAEHAALSPYPIVGHDGVRFRSRSVPRELDLFMDEPPNLTVVLDLDETLVRSCDRNDVPIYLEFAASMGKLTKLEVECIGSSNASTWVVSFLRPGLYEFLERVSKLADVYIFTAGDPDYARPLLQLLDHEGKFFLGSYYRETTVATTVHDHVKDLTRLGVDLTRTVLVDNNPYSFLFQPDNGILCESFYGEPEDRHLLDVVLPTLHLLARVPDVRPILRRRYNLAGWCQTVEDWYY